jgi:hypothetical protein
MADMEGQSFEDSSDVDAVLPQGDIRQSLTELPENDSIDYQLRDYASRITGLCNDFNCLLPCDNFAPGSLAYQAEIRGRSAYNEVRVALKRVGEAIDTFEKRVNEFSDAVLIDDETYGVGALLGMSRPSPRKHSNIVMLNVPSYRPHRAPA